MIRGWYVLLLGWEGVAFGRRRLLLLLCRLRPPTLPSRPLVSPSPGGGGGCGEPSSVGFHPPPQLPSAAPGCTVRYIGVLIKLILYI